MSTLKKAVESSENTRLKSELAAALLRADAAEKQAETAVATLEKSRAVQPPRKLKPLNSKRLKGDFVEVVVGDIHGNHADPAAMAGAPTLTDAQLTQRAGNIVDGVHAGRGPGGPGHAGFRERRHQYRR